MLVIKGKEDFDYLKRVIEMFFVEEPPKGLGEMFYHTLSYEGDKLIYDRLKGIFEDYDSLC
jgi:hypothetical protein